MPPAARLTIRARLCRSNGEDAVFRALGLMLLLSSSPLTPAAADAPAVADDPAGPESVPAATDTLCARQLAAMTPAAKAGQMIIVYNTDADFLRTHQVGGIILFQPMITDSLLLRREIEQKQRAVAIPLLVCIDQEGGRINRLSNLAPFATTPSAAELSRMPDHAVRESAAALTAYLRSVGINLNFAPCLDPARSLATGAATYIADQDRSFGDRPALIARKAGAFLAGVNRRDGLAVAKHFPGYDAPQNSDQHLTTSAATAEAVAQYLVPFAELAPACAGVMMSNIVYSALDSLPAVISPKVVAWARSLYGDGIVVTDDLWAVSVRQVVDPTVTSLRQETSDRRFGELVQRAVLAGNDMLLITYPTKVPVMIAAITRLMETDPPARALVDAAVLRILRLKQRL
jgi:beta-glucosidase-like glycosyl hydrolase